MIEIRTEGPGDYEAVRRLHEQVFNRPNEATLVERLRDGKKANISLVAVQDGRLVGHILFSPVTVSAAPDGVHVIGLAPVSVAPECQGKGIGSSLIREGLNHCKQSGYGAVVVLGDPRYYSRFGFIRASDYNLDNEYGAVEAFRILELREGTIQQISGTVAYQPEFREAGC